MARRISSSSFTSGRGLRGDVTIHFCRKAFQSTGERSLPVFADVPRSRRDTGCEGIYTRAVLAVS